MTGRVPVGPRPVQRLAPLTHFFYLPPPAPGEQVALRDPQGAWAWALCQEGHAPHPASPRGPSDSCSRTDAWLLSRPGDATTSLKEVVLWVSRSHKAQDVSPFSETTLGCGSCWKPNPGVLGLWEGIPGGGGGSPASPTLGHTLLSQLPGQRPVPPAAPRRPAAPRSHDSSHESPHLHLIPPETRRLGGTTQLTEEDLIPQTSCPPCLPPSWSRQGASYSSPESLFPKTGPWARTGCPGVMPQGRGLS